MDETLAHTGTGEYSAQLPNNVWDSYNSDFEMSYSGYLLYGEWQETVQVSYPISNKQIDGPSVIDLIMSNNRYSIDWYYKVDENQITVDIYTWPDGRIWYMTYDAVSGSLLSMTK